MSLFPEVSLFFVFHEIHVLFGLDLLSSKVPVLSSWFDFLLILLLDSLMEAGHFVFLGLNSGGLFPLGFPLGLNPVIVLLLHMALESQFFR